jgi:hypothetical protein
MTLKHLPQRSVSLLSVKFNAAFLAQYSSSVWKQARIVSIMIPWIEPALSSPYCPISLLDTIDKLPEKILLNGILSELSGRGLLRDEHFGFRPIYSTSL